MDDGPVAQLSDTHARITDEGIALMRARIGVVVPRERPFNEYASIDGIRHFVEGHGDDNPLYTDPAYGAGTRWGDMIASPVFLTTTGVSEIKRLRPEVRKLGEHALAGVHEFFSGDEWEWFLPVYPGDRFTRRYYLYAVDEKERSTFTGGRSVITKYRADYVNQRGELVAVDRFLFVRAERDAAVKSGKNMSIQRTRYSPEEIREVEDAYAKQARRGAESRSWEDVSVGDALPPMVKGPLVLTDVIAWMRGWGAGVKHSRLAWKDRRHRPKFYSMNDYGIPDIVERVHWEDSWARKIGNPIAYDFGRMRSCYLSEIVTNWMGDDAWLWKMSNQFRAFNYHGDIQWVKGTVTGKEVDGEGHPLVHLDMSCENQRGEITAPGKATVILPSRASGPVDLPKPGKHTEGTVQLIY